MNGYAFGGGIELALAAVLFMPVKRQLAQPAGSQAGHRPLTAAACWSTEILPPAIVNEMVMTGKRSGQEACVRGIVNRVVSSETDNARELAQQLVLAPRWRLRR
ncbi:enoyl-CoA hydratase-related protein [Shigella flexneri]